MGTRDDRKRSRQSHVTAPPNNSVTGLGVKRCCALIERNTKETVHNGCTLIRIRYGLPYSELPDVHPSELHRYLSFLLLQGKERSPVAFPRRQVFKPAGDGLCNLQRLRRHERWEFALSLASIKRNLPPGCSRHTPSMRSDWEKNAFSQPPPSSPDFLNFVQDEVSQIFRPKWDRYYRSFVKGHVPNPTCRKLKGFRADELWAGRREEFFTRCLFDSEESHLTARYKEVPTAGKTRPLLIFDEDVELLAPLHKMMYKHLCEQSWLLCGPPTEERMKSVCTNAYQTSVDLVAATDNLRHDVSRVILDTIFSYSRRIPSGVRALAYSSLCPTVVDADGVSRDVSHGQMMGAYLSFPLLCLHSFVAARWASRSCPEARILINGDDCVISANREIGEMDYPQGYRLNTDKTIRAKGVVDINSTVFLFRGGRWREVRNLRRGGAIADFPGMLHMAKACQFIPAWRDAYQRARIGRRWGFLPSQISHEGYPAYLRERGLAIRRNFTELPTRDDHPDMQGLVRIYGSDPDPVATEALRAFTWLHGRRGGLKRDAYAPSIGYVRRTYSYRAIPCWSKVSFVSLLLSRKLRRGRKTKVPFYDVPEDFLTEQEKEGLDELASWALACDAVTIE